MWYNYSAGEIWHFTCRGLNFKLDVGLYQLDQQVACQRYRQHFLDANVSETRDELVAEVANLFAPKRAVFALAA